MLTDIMRSIFMSNVKVIKNPQHAYQIGDLRM